MLVQPNPASGITSPGYICLLGLLTACWSFTGYDSAAHLIEETISGDLTAGWPMLYAIITSFTVGLLYLLSLTATIQVIFVNPNCRYSTYQHVLCMLHLTLCQGGFKWTAWHLAYVSDGMCIRPKLHGMQSNLLPLLFIKSRLVYNHVVCACCCLPMTHNELS